MKRLFGMALLASLAVPMFFSSCKKDEDENDDVKVTKVELDIHEKDAFVGDVFTLKATVLPANATNKKVTWYVGDDKIAKVENGIVETLSNGVTYVYVKTADGGLKDSCKVLSHGNIEIADSKFLAALVADKNINTDGDDGISRREAELTEEIDLSLEESISSLDGIEYFYNLKKLNCSGNKISSLDLSKLTFLNYLKCDQNQLTALDLSKNTELTYLHCAKNKIDTLDIRKNEKLETILCGNQSDTIKLILSIDQYNGVWNEKKDNSNNSKVDLIMNIFENAVFKSTMFDKNLKKGESVSVSIDEDSFNFQLFDSSKNDKLSFIEASLLNQLKWESSNEKVAKIVPSNKEEDGLYYVQVKVSLLSQGETDINVVDGQGNKIFFTLKVTK